MGKAARAKRERRQQQQAQRSTGNLLGLSNMPHLFPRDLSAYVRAMRGLLRDGADYWLLNQRGYAARSQTWPPSQPVADSWFIELGRNLPPSQAADALCAHAVSDGLFPPPLAQLFRDVCERVLARALRTSVIKRIPDQLWAQEIDAVPIPAVRSVLRMSLLQDLDAAPLWKWWLFHNLDKWQYRSLLEYWEELPGAQSEPTEGGVSSPLGVVTHPHQELRRFTRPDGEEGGTGTPDAAVDEFRDQIVDYFAVNPTDEQPFASWHPAGSRDPQRVLQSSAVLATQHGTWSQRRANKTRGPADALLLRRAVLHRLLQACAGAVMETGALLWTAETAQHELKWIMGTWVTTMMLDHMVGTVSRAQCYWLPPSMVDAVVHSSGLDDSDREQMRLPYERVFLTFGAPLSVHNSPDLWADRARLSPQAKPKQSALLEDFHLPKLPPTYRVPNYLQALPTLPGFLIHGIFLRSDDNGRILDDVIWAISSAEESDSDSPGLFAVPGSLRRSGLARQVWASAALLSWWPEWERPRQRRQAQSAPAPLSSTARPASAQDELQVLVPRRSESRSARPDHEPTHHKRTHTRRGHWRRLSPTRKVWVRPTIINPGGTEMVVNRVQVVPEQATQAAEAA